MYTFYLLTQLQLKHAKTSRLLWPTTSWQTPTHRTQQKKISLGTQLVFEGLQRGSLDRLAVLLSQRCRSHRSGAQHGDAGSAAQGTAGGAAGTTQGAGTWGRAARACGCDWLMSCKLQKLATFGTQLNCTKTLAASLVKAVALEFGSQ